MKIAFFEIFNEVVGGDKEMLEKTFPSDQVSCFGEKLSTANVNSIKDADIISVFTGSMVNKDIIDSLPDLKFINTSTTGFDHIDVSYAKGKGIPVSNVPAYGSHTVAEFAFALILDLSRNVIKANNYIKGSADYKYFDSMEGFDLAGKTLGIIGTGKIGKNVVKIAKGFAMEVIAYDLYPDQAFAKDNHFTYLSFPEVIAKSDIITLHAPYTKENHHLINKENILMMKKGVYLINTARGELIDTDALVFGLKEGIIAGAGLDVLEKERELKEEVEMLASDERSDRLKDYKTLLEDRVLMEMSNVVITPHIAFYTHQAVNEIKRVTIENIKGFIAGNPVNFIK